MKVSIITPCYNAANHIAATIQSIQQQTLSDWELIIVDDGSADNSACIIRDISACDPRIKLVQKGNGGTASARRAGLEVARGEYIQFLDADDKIENDKLSRQVALMEEENLDVSYTDWCYLSSNGVKGEMQGMNCNLARLLCLWGVLGTLPIHCFLYRRDFLLSHNINFATAIREREDWDFHIQVFSARPSYKRMKDYCGAYYFISPSGKTTGATQERIQLGNFRFLKYKIDHTTIKVKALLLLRFSVELWHWILRTVRYKYTNKLFSKKNFYNDYSFYKSFTIGVFLLPLSILLVVATSIIKRVH